MASPSPCVRLVRIIVHGYNVAMNPLVISLFSGAGGLSRGLSEAGLKPSLAAEIDPDAVETYRHNVSEDVLQADISAEADRIVAETRRRFGQQPPLLVAGGPPCQGFSTAGARDHTDSRNRLVFSYLEIIERLKPTWFLFENVEGILTSGEGDSIVGLVQRFTDLGYTLRVEKVNFARWGVPQARKRVLIVGNSRGIRFELPEATHAFDGKKHKGYRGNEAITLGEAIAGLPPAPVPDVRTPVSYVTEAPASAFDGRMRTRPPGPRAHTVAPLDREIDRIRLLKPGQSLKDLPEELWPNSYRSRAYRRVADGMPVEKRGGAPAGIRRLDSSHASLTITGFSPRELIHPSLDRWLSLRECARLQTFPDAHDFRGNFQAVAQQIGNAVPPMAAGVLGSWIREVDGRAGSDTGTVGGTAKPGLFGYHLTDASGMSPALQTTDARLRALMQSSPSERPTMARPPGAGRPRRRPPAQPCSLQAALFEAPAATRLSPDDKRLVTQARTLNPIKLSDRELARLVSVVLHDLGHDDLVPNWVGVPSGVKYYDLPMAWFKQDEQREFKFEEFFLSCVAQVDAFRTIFRCLCALHTRRRKYERILQNQPVPTMDQVAPRGLLEHGIVRLPGLTSWLMWRKWVYDVDNRSAQETGYLFEPMLAASLGGQTYGSKNSPVTRGGKGSGRQVDCVVDAEGESAAYEFKARMTIAASGQGRFEEELSFPEDCRASGYKPILLVLDPTPSDKLTALTATFRRAGGEVYLGEAVWEHVREKSGDEIAAFVQTYIREPILSIATHEEELLDLGLRYRTGSGGDILEVTVGEQSWVIPRPRGKSGREVDEGGNPEAGEDPEVV